MTTFLVLSILGLLLHAAWFIVIIKVFRDYRKKTDYLESVITNSNKKIL